MVMIHKTPAYFKQYDYPVPKAPEKGLEKDKA